MATIQKLSDELFQTIYKDVKLRNAVAYAHSYTAVDKLISFEAQCYPNSYEVTANQIELANEELQRAKGMIFDLHANHLLFVGMGSYFEPRWEDDITNHRFRTQFTNRNGNLFFIEICSTNDKTLHVDYATDLDAEKLFKSKLEELWKEQSQYSRKSNEYQTLSKKIIEYRNNEPTSNYGNICHDTRGYQCTKSDIIKLVNEVFECDFKRMVIDNYTISMNDREIICQSPVNSIDEEQKFISEHRSKYPLPFEELTKYSSFDQILGPHPEDYTPKQRFERWNKVMSLDEEIKEIFADTLACDGCIHLDKLNPWCNDYGLPCSYNPVLKMLGMACGGACKSTIISKPIQLQIF